MAHSITQKSILIAALALGLLAVPALAQAVGGTTGSQTLSAGVSVSHTCQTSGDGIALSFAPPKFDASLGAHVVEQLHLSNIEGACVGRSLTVTALDASGAVLGEASQTITGYSLTVSFSPISAERVADVAVVIY